MKKEIVVAEEKVEGKESAPEKEKGGNSSGWAIAIFMLIVGVLAGLGILEWQNNRDEQLRKSFTEEKARLEKELETAKVSLQQCEAKPKCVKPKKHTRKKIHRPTPAPERLASKPQAEEKMFDASLCGDGTEMTISKVTGKPECRAIPVAIPTPVYMRDRVVEKPKQKPEMVCEKPNILQLRDDGSTACIALPATQQPTTQSPPGCFTDAQGRIMCPRNREAKKSSWGSWIPWAVSGAAVLWAVDDHRKNRKVSSPGPNVVTLPPGPGVVTNPPGPGVATLPPGPGVTTLPAGPEVTTW
ncbi:MAG TPA: hypothetical protein DCS20_01485 [Candidatus Yonathbacteria bacterium]|nr:hypothetical protein [Candidatus Yonathbacteria bacterium]